jgi:hypothetical protein
MVNAFVPIAILTHLLPELKVNVSSTSVAEVLPLACPEVFVVAVLAAPTAIVLNTAGSSTV